MLSIQEEMKLMAEQLQHHFSSDQLEQLARQTGFVQRKSKCEAQDFVSLCTFLDDEISVSSLNELCSVWRQFAYPIFYLFK